MKEAHSLGIIALVLSILTITLLMSVVMVLQKRFNLFKTFSFSNKIEPNSMSNKGRFRSYTKMFAGYFSNIPKADGMCVVVPDSSPTQGTKPGDFWKVQSLWDASPIEQKRVLESSMNSTSSFQLDSSINSTNSFQLQVKE